MEGKKTKRRKTTSNKNCHGRQEPKEKPKASEVMDDKELHDRFEAANVLSSLMFLPPKYSNDDTLIKKSEISTENATKQLTYLATSVGIPVSLSNHISTEGKQGLIKGSGSFGVSYAMSIEQTSAILAHLQNKIALSALKSNTSPKTQTQSVVANHLLRNITSIASGLCSNTVSTVIKAKPVILPLSLVTSSSSQNAAPALQHIVSSTSNMKINTAFEIAETGATALASATYNVIPTVATHFTSSIPILRSEMLTPRQKKETAENNLPLKKRRVLPVYEYSDDVSSAITIPSILYNNSLESLESSNNINNYEPISPGSSAECMQKATTLMPGITETTLHQDDSYQPSQFDPCTSLMVLSDVKLALTPDDDGDLPIHIAVVHENTELVNKFIDIMTMSGKTVDRFNKLQQTPLHLAVLVNKPDIVVALLSAGANPNLVDRHGCTSIHTTICKQFPECRNAVVKYTRFTCNLNSRDYEGYPSLHKCVELNDIDSMKFLVQNGADINVQDGKAGRSVLLYATEYKRLNMVEFLLENQVDVELQNYAGVSALQTAQADDLDDILQLLHKALNISKPYEEPVVQSSKKLPIPRIPSKSQLISNGLCSRSDSLSQHSKSDISQTLSMSSYTSPIDLSIHRNTESPSPSKELNSHIKKENKTSKGKGKHGKVKTSAPSIIKKKHASVVAALESRNVHPSGTVYKVGHFNKMQPASSSNYHSLLTDELRKKLKIGNKGIERKNVEREPDSDISQKIKQNDRNVQGQVVATDQMKEQILGSIISASLLAESDNNNSNPIYVACVNENYSDISEDEESVEKLTKDDADMDSMDSPVSPRTTPFTNKPFTAERESNETDYMLENQSLRSELKETISETATPKIVDLELAPLKSNVNDVDKSIHDNNVIDRFKEVCKEKKGLVKHPVTSPYGRSSIYSSSAAFLNSQGIEYTDEITELEQRYVPSYAQSDESMEVDMSDITKLNEEANKSESDGVQVTNRLSEQILLRDSNDEDDSQGLVIDERDTEEDNECANLYPSDLKESENMGDKNEFNTLELWLSEKSNDDDKENCKKLKKYNEGFASSVAHSKTVTDGIYKTVSSINTELSLSENKSELESNCNVKMVEDWENSSQFCKNAVVCSRNSVTKLPEPNLLNHSDVNDSLRKKYEKENIVSNDTGPSVVQSNKLVQKPEVNPSYIDKSRNTYSMQEHLKTTVKSHTLYFQDGNDYKPLRIFMDDSVQSSLVLQKMLLASRFTNTQYQKQSNEPVSMETAMKQNITSAGTRINTGVSDGMSSNQSCGLVTSLMNIHDNQKPINSTFTINTVHNNSVTHSAFVMQNAFIDTDLKPSQLLTNPKNESPSLTSVPNIPNIDLQHIKPYLNADKVKKTENSADFDTPSIIGSHGDVKSCPQKSDFLSRTSTNLVNHTNKRTPSSVVKTTLVTLNGKSTCPGEGTLTRVNPDVRSKLSKALLSSQTKVALSRTLSGPDADTVYPDIPSFSSSFVETNARVITTVSETRQPF